MSFIIQTKNLEYVFKDFKAVDRVNLNVPKGSIYCFLGPNGAGKTTTIRTLLGLYSVPVNTIKIFGKDIKHNRINILKNIGSLVETPSLYDHLTAMENLNILRYYSGGSKNRINEVLKIVDLEHASNKKVKAMSLGMKQRLALAIALFNEPELLILDEPTNGLDPQGIREVRELLMKLNKENGITIFLSSHILSEVEKLASNVGVINKGRLVFEGTIGQLKNAKEKLLMIETESSVKAKSILVGDFDCKIENNNVISLRANYNGNLNLILKRLIDSNIEIFSVRNDSGNLEELFFQLTEDTK